MGATATRWIKDRLSWAVSEHKSTGKKLKNLGDAVRFVDAKHLNKWLARYEEPDCKYTVPKWLFFLQTTMEWNQHGVYCWVYKAKTTVSKYLYISNGEPMKTFKMRFSNHRAPKHREESNDCDFYVGLSSGPTIRTDQLITHLRGIYGINDNI